MFHNALKNITVAVSRARCSAPLLQMQASSFQEARVCLGAGRTNLKLFHSFTKQGNEMHSNSRCGDKIFSSDVSVAKSARGAFSRSNLRRLTMAMLWSVGLLLFWFAGSARAQVLTAVDDTYGVPFGQPLVVEAFGVLGNDTLDGGAAGEGGATAELVSSVSHGSLTCPSNLSLELCADGSFEYVPGPTFGGTDTFIYRAVFGTVTSQATVTLTACMGGPQVYSCWQEASYLAKLAELGYSTFQEGFEGAAWDAARSPTTSPAITSMGVTWTSNHPATNDITTGSGAARTGLWGIYDPDHGFATGTATECDVNNPPAHCLYQDGFSGSVASGSGDTLHGVGGFITGTVGANIAIVHGGTQTGFGQLPDAGYHFFGVIDASAAGFTHFEVRELDGKVGQQRLIFGDDFTLTAVASSGNTAPVADAGPPQAVFLGEAVMLDGSGSFDPDNDPLTFQWSFVSKPPLSGATLDATDPVHPTFVADLEGTYRVQLIVNDGMVDSAPDTVDITATAVPCVPSFTDVPCDYWAFIAIEKIFAAGITSGCGGGNYCPSRNVTRNEMAVFLLRGIHGGSYVPPPATGMVFLDVSLSSFAAAWIEQLAAEGITSGCGGGNYCPSRSIARNEMAVFLLRAKHGSSYVPPPATGTVFSDVSVSSFAAAWIEQLAAEGITTGCGGGKYCPGDPVTRDQMAVFLMRTFNL